MANALIRLSLLVGATVLHAAAPLPHGPIEAQLPPDPQVATFHFPEAESTLTGWVTQWSRQADADAFARLHLHGWGLWTAATLETPQRVNGQPLRVFETWLTPDDLTGDPSLGTVAAITRRPRSRAPLRPLAQLRRRAAAPDRFAASGEAGDDRILGFIKFDPTAAGHILSQNLLSASALDLLLDAGAQQVAPFPATALAAKPIFQIVRASDLVEGRYYLLKVWPGPPDSPRAWGPAQWPGAVWIDLLDGGTGRGAVDPAPVADGSTRTSDTTYPVAGLIHYQLSAADAAAVNTARPGTGASAGDTALLLGMHLAGRELARWTWQTFWWSPTPDDPHAPSSAAIAALRPPQLQGAARNYAMAPAYTLFTPDQPYLGGTATGAPVYAYNPWIEARFTPNDLPDSQPGPGPDGRTASNNWGVQTNCLSCHLRANYNPQKLATAPRLSGLRYTDLGDPQFVGTLQVDFLWSLAASAR